LNKVVTSLLLFSFSLYLFSGCAAPQQTQVTGEKQRAVNENLPVVFSYSKEDVYKASILAIQQKSFLITLSDPFTGIVSGEYASTSLLPEEEAALASQNSEFASTCVTILGILLVVGLIYAIVKSNDSSSNNNSSNRNHEHESYDSDYSSSDSKVYSYKYTLSIYLTELDKERTEVRLQLIKMNLENGAVVSQTEMPNEMFNKHFYKLMENSLSE